MIIITSNKAWTDLCAVIYKNSPTGLMISSWIWKDYKKNENEKLHAALILSFFESSRYETYQNIIGCRNRVDNCIGNIRRGQLWHELNHVMACVKRSNITLNEKIYQTIDNWVNDFV